jgi:pimeloyl-ACP methyl ester carboxylesterase/uncharacterized damage-inducible protein DinB
VNFNEVPYRYPARSVVVDGFRVAYVDVNPDAADAVVFMHEVGGDLDDFAPVYERFGPDRRAVGMDLVGFGKSDKPRLDDPVLLYTDLLGGFLDALDLERVALVGHGIGALVAARFAGERPERVSRLVLSAVPGVRELSGDELATADDFWAFDRVSAFDEAGRRGWYEAMVAGWNDRLEAYLGVREDLASSLAFRPWAHAVEDAASSMLRHPLGERLGRIHAPPLLVWGVDDPVVPFAGAAAAREGIADARVVAIEECGHLPGLEQPEAWADAIAAFLAEAETATVPTGDLARGVRDVEPWPGFTPGVGRLATMLFEQRDVCLRLAEKLSVDDVAWQPSPGANSVGALLLHMGATAIWYLYEVLRGEPVPAELAARFCFDPDDDHAPLRAPRKSAARLVAEVEWAHEQLAEWLRGRTDADLNRAHTPRRGGTAMTLRWILWHLVEDTLHHRGQIAYIRRLVAELPEAKSMYQTPPAAGS